MVAIASKFCIRYFDKVQPLKNLTGLTSFKSSALCKFCPQKVISIKSTMNNYCLITKFSKKEFDK